MEYFPTLPVLSLHPCQSRARPQVSNRAGNLALRQGAEKSPACSPLSGLAFVLLWGVQICSQSVCFADVTPRHTGTRYTDREGAIVSGTFLTPSLLSPADRRCSPALDHSLPRASFAGARALHPPRIPSFNCTLAPTSQGFIAIFLRFAHLSAPIWPLGLHAHLWQTGSKSSCR